MAFHGILIIACIRHENNNDRDKGMSLAERLYTSALSTIFAAAAVGVGHGAEQYLYEALKHPVAGDVVLEAAIGVGIAGVALLAASGALYFGKETIHPR